METMPMTEAQMSILISCIIVFLSAVIPAWAVDFRAEHMIFLSDLLLIVFDF